MDQEEKNTTTAQTPETDPYAAYTPVMRQYLTLKDQNPGVLLLYRLGDFYETFFDDARKVNRLLGLTLTRRGKNSDGSNIPMAGVPASTLDQYLARLVRAGESVAVCEQVGETQGTRGMMERKIVRIVTPGTLTDNALLAETKDSTLLAWVPGKGRDTTDVLVWITLTNGTFKAMKCPASSLASELARIAPSEILLADHLRDKFPADYEVPVTALPDWHFDARRGAELIREKFGLESLAARGLENEAQILAAVNAILGYVGQTQCDALPFIRPLQIESDENYVVLDAATRRNLEITETLRGDEGATLVSVIDHCSTSMGSRMMRHWLHHPLRDAERVRARHNAVEELLTNKSGAERLATCVVGLPDIERTSGRLALKSIRPKEIAALRDCLPQIAQLAQLANAFSSPLLRKLAQSCTLDASLFVELTRVIADDPAALLREGDVIATGADSELDELRAMRDHTGDYLVQLELREREETGISSLRVEYNRVSGYYIEVPRGQADKVPATYRRRQTLKNAERFITPELKEFEDKALSAKERALALEKKLWDELLERIQPFVKPLLDTAGALASLDVLLSFARHAETCDWTKPTMTAIPGVDLQRARHPVVEHAIEHYVPNDCRLAHGRRLLVITGPNMGGKSTYMRSVALIVLLACAGSFVPAKSARIGPIDRILTRIGASDDLARGRSTFMVEMTEAAAILHQATENSLVLMDEIGRGTSTFDGLSLAAAIARELAEHTKSFTLFATHYFELTQLAAETADVANVHVSARETGKGIVFLHDVREGPANQSYGIAVAELAGMPARVTRRARAILAEIEAKNVHTGAQLDLFTVEAPEEPVRREDPSEAARREFVTAVTDLDVDGMTPRDALATLYELQKKAKSLEA